MAAPGPSPYADGSPLLDRSPLAVSDPDLAVPPTTLPRRPEQHEQHDPAAARTARQHDARQHEHDAAVVEQRSFARAVCATCGWRGPGRRARAFAVADIEEHRLLGSAAVTIDLRERG